MTAKNEKNNKKNKNRICHVPKYENYFYLILMAMLYHMLSIYPALNKTQRQKVLVHGWEFVTQLKKEQTI